MMAVNCKPCRGSKIAVAAAAAAGLILNAGDVNSLGMQPGPQWGGRTHQDRDDPSVDRGDRGDPPRVHPRAPTSPRREAAAVAAPHPPSPPPFHLNVYEDPSSRYGINFRNSFDEFYTPIDFDAMENEKRFLIDNNSDLEDEINQLSDPRHWCSWQNHFYMSKFLVHSDLYRANTQEMTPQQITRIKDPFVVDSEAFRQFQDFLRNTSLYKSDLSLNTEYRERRDTAILGRFDVLVVPTVAERDRKWKFIEKANRNQFSVFHMAAPDLSDHPEVPFFIYRDDGSIADLNERKYLNTMYLQMKALVTAANFERITDLVLFPYGMGAFLRKLPRLVPRYANLETNYNLRASIVESFLTGAVATLSLRSSIKRIHVGLPFAKDVGGFPINETNLNYHAWMAKIKVFQDVFKERRISLHLYGNEDVFYLSHKLASDRRSRVGMWNGANKMKIGNHWYGGRANSAIDENIHRRSKYLAASAFYLNWHCGLVPDTPYGASPGQKEPFIKSREPVNFEDTSRLQKAVLALAGKVYLSRDESFTPGQVLLH